MEIKDLDYKVGTYQGFLQELVYLFSRGYFYYCVANLPEKKRDKWEKIDYKLIEKYQTAKSKWQRHRAKIDKKANFIYLSYDATGIIMHTLGDIPSDITCDDVFLDIRRKPLVVQISELSGFEISYEKTVEVRLTQETYKGFRSKLADIAALKSPDLLKHEFNMINGYPAWGGIIQQKRQLAKFAVNQAGKHQFKMCLKDFRINTKRKVYPVWVKGGF